MLEIEVEMKNLSIEKVSEIAKQLAQLQLEIKKEYSVEVRCT